MGQNEINFLQPLSPLCLRLFLTLRPLRRQLVAAVKNLSYNPYVDNMGRKVYEKGKSRG